MANRKQRNRGSNSKPLRRIIVIATEGKVTERRYFDALNKYTSDTNIKRVPRSSKRTDPMQVLDDLIKFKNAQGAKYDRDTTYWIIVDWERRSYSEMQNVVSRARDNDCLLADSNPCFEVWLFQHFCALKSVRGLAGRLKSGGCNKMINQLRQGRYDPSYDKSKYNVLKYLRRIDLAMKNANKDEIGSDSDAVGSRVFRFIGLLGSINSLSSSPNNPSH